MAPNGIPHLQLPVLTPLEPLTSGTNLPHVPAGELTPTESSTKDPRPPPTPTSLDASSTTTTPPQSPDRATSMRRFLSRVSLNSSYTHEDDDRASVLSGPLSPTVSVMSRDSKRKTSGGSKKGSWWKKSKDKKEDKNQNITRLPPTAAAAAIVVAAQVATPGDESYSSPASSPQTIARTKTVQSIAPPPRLPDDLFGNGFSSLDSDMFKNFK